MRCSWRTGSSRGRWQSAKGASAGERLPTRRPPPATGSIGTTLSSSRCSAAYRSSLVPLVVALILIEH